MESLGLAPRALPPTLPGGGGVLGVDSIQRLLLAKATCPALGGSFQKETLFLGFFFHFFFYNQAGNCSRRGGEAGRGWGTSTATPLCGVGGKWVPFGSYEGRGVPKVSGRKAAVRWLCGLFKQVLPTEGNHVTGILSRR